MAIVQISRLQQRRGLADDLPQLAAAEFGWAVDERRLYIGNGTIQEGAPVIGNTEILTEFSNILEFQSAYTYKGEAAGYTVQTGSTPANPVSQSIQSRLDSFAVVTDFGAIGDGVTDDTEAINRALYQLLCRQTNPQVRRGLFFPAGVYLVTESILIPPYAYLYGEGPTSSVILLDAASDISTLNAYVARTADSSQNFGVNIGANNATPPQDITIENMGFESLQNTDIFLVDSAKNVSFRGVGFQGPLTYADSQAPTTRDNIAAIRFNSTTSLVTTNITFDTCLFAGCTYGIQTGEKVYGVHVTNSNFQDLYQGVYWGGPGFDSTIGGPAGCAVTHSTFNYIWQEGIYIDGVEKNVSGYNIFLDNVGTGGSITIGSTTYTTPPVPIVNIDADNCVSTGDMFLRDDTLALTYPRVFLNEKASIATDNGSVLYVGNYQREAGIAQNVSGLAISETLLTVQSNQSQAFRIDYTFVRGPARRYGSFTVIADPSISYFDDYYENSSTGLTLSAAQFGSTITISYFTSLGSSGVIYYSLAHLD